jgi:hypothetical protein
MGGQTPDEVRSAERFHADSPYLLVGERLEGTMPRPYAAIERILF